MGASSLSTCRRERWDFHEAQRGPSLRPATKALAYRRRLSLVCWQTQDSPHASGARFLSTSKKRNRVFMGTTGHGYVSLRLDYRTSKRRSDLDSARPALAK